MHDFHSDVRKWPSNAFSILYRSLLNVLVVKDADSLQYFKIIVEKCPFVRKGLTICNLGDLSTSTIESEIRSALASFGIAQKKIEREMDNIHVVTCKLGERESNLDELAKLVIKFL